MENEYQGLTYDALRRQLKQRLMSVVAEEEAGSLAIRVLEHASGLDKIGLLRDGGIVVGEDAGEIVSAIETRLMSGEPFQYILGYQSFYGRNFKVGPAVLIPRPETEELCAIIISDLENSGPVRILDLASGSGCIAITLDLELAESDIKALDICPEALEIANHNQKALGSGVHFFQHDILDPLKGLSDLMPFDVLVSNPPYVLMSEKEKIESRVKDHEPEIALFVPDDDALLFYRCIGQMALDGLLSKPGCIYFEINPLRASELHSYFSLLGFRVKLMQDMFGKDRFLRASR